MWGKWVPRGPQVEVITTYPIFQNFDHCVISVKEHVTKIVF